MSQHFHYGWEGVDTDLGTEVARLGDYGGYSQKAEAGDVGSCELIFDDPDNDLPDSGLEGLGDLWVAEDDCDPIGSGDTSGVGGQRLFSGYITDRVYRRGDATRSSLIVGANRQVSVQLVDLNAVASFLIFHSGTAVRPAETDIERIQWLLTDPARPLWSATDDAGFVDTSNPVDMDATDYTGQTPADVLADCATASGKNWFIGYWEENDSAFLWYADSNTSTAYTSDLAISNLLSEIDVGSDWTTWTTFPPKLGTDAELTRSPNHRYKGVFLPFAGGYAYKTNSDSALGYAWRDGSAPNANVTTQTAADAEAQRLADDATGETDRITCSVQLPSSLVTHIKHGQRIQCRFTHLPGYESPRWMRVMSLQVAQDEATDQRYTLGLELTPQAPIIDVLYDATVTGTEAWFPGADHGVLLQPATRYNWTITVTRTSGAEFGYGTRWMMVTGPSSSGTEAGGTNTNDWIDASALPHSIDPPGNICYALTSDSAASNTIFGIPVTVSGYFITPNPPTWNPAVAYFMYYNVNQSHGATTWSAHITLTLG